MGLSEATEALWRVRNDGDAQEVVNLVVACQKGLSGARRRIREAAAFRDSVSLHQSHSLILAAARTPAKR